MTSLKIYVRESILKSSHNSNLKKLSKIKYKDGSKKRGYKQQIVKSNFLRKIFCHIGDSIYNSFMIFWPLITLFDCSSLYLSYRCASVAEWLARSDPVPLLRIGELVRFLSSPFYCGLNVQLTNPIVCSTTLLKLRLAPFW